MSDDSIFRLLLLHETTFHIHREQYKTMQEQKFHFLKKVRKIFFAVAGSVLLLFLLYDLTELLVVSCPGTIRVYSWEECRLKRRTKFG